MKEILLILVALALCILTYEVTAYRDVDYLKKESPKFLNERGFTITSYDGYEGCVFHGGLTYYQVRDSENYLYSLATGEWRGEIMIYNQECLNAVSNK